MPHKPTIPRVCEHCGTDFLAEAFKVNKGHGRFCSTPCRVAYRNDPTPVMPEPDGTARIPLRGANGSIRAYAVIDANDLSWVNQWRWCLNSTGYAVRRVKTPRGARLLRLHRALLELDFDDDIEVDHINRVKLDNRRNNLRPATRDEQMQNIPARRGASSAYRGVRWFARDKKWQATVSHDGRQKHLGYFHSELEAAKVARAARARLMPYAVD